MSYATLQDLRDAGMTAQQLPDPKAQAALDLASRYIDRMTGRWFEPRTQTIRLDGHGTPTLFLGAPIIAITQVVAGTGHNLAGVPPISLTNVVVYNRHLQGLTSPDDREDPRLVLEGTEYWVGGPTHWGGPQEYVGAKWPRGRQNIEVQGSFGYTDYDGTATGKTPDLIKRACVLIALRFAPAPASAGYQDAIARHRLLSERTRDQSYQLAALLTQGAWTGDPEIDGILAGYVRGPSIGAV